MSPRAALPRPRRWRHWTLRSRLAAAAAGLAAVALVAADAAGLLLLENHLVERVDRQLESAGADALGRLFLPRTREAGERAGAPAPDTRLGASLVYAFDADGTPRGVHPPAAADPAAGGPDLPRFRDLAARGGAPFTVPDRGGGHAWRVRVVRSPADGTVYVPAASLADVEETTDRLLLIDAAVTGLVLVLLGAAAALVVRLGLRPLTRMEATAGHIAGGDFTRRVADADPHTEPGRLGAAMNTMLGRVEAEIAARAASEARLRRFLADASHELRTPLTSIRGFAELYRRGGAPPGPRLDDTMGRIESEAARMGVLVDDLLLLARQDEQRHLERRPVDLLALAADLVRDLHARSPGRPVRLTGLDAGGGLFEQVVVAGDALRLRQVLGNLLANADRHTPADAAVTVRVGTAAPARLEPAAVAVGPELPPHTPAAVVEVRDTGPGIPPRHAPHVFERLYRADPSRTSASGAGLGLSIAAALAGAHGGRVELVTAPGRGAAFRVLLPLAEG